MSAVALVLVLACQPFVVKIEPLNKQDLSPRRGKHLALDSHSSVGLLDLVCMLNRMNQRAVVVDSRLTLKRSPRHKHLAA